MFQHLRPPTTSDPYKLVLTDVQLLLEFIGLGRSLEFRLRIRILFFILKCLQREDSVADTLETIRDILQSPKSVEVPV